MHALGRFITELMDARSMSRPDLERTSGLSRQHLHQLLDDRRTHLGRMIDHTTITALATAFPDLGETTFILKAAESLGVPIDRLTTTIDPNRLSNEALLGILAKRLKDTDTTAQHQVADIHPATPAAQSNDEPVPTPDQRAARRGPRARTRLDSDWSRTDGEQDPH
jgi:transcriptional regulator with XRE-family HTH domain